MTSCAALIDASSLILLAKASVLRLFAKQVKVIGIVPAVHKEVTAKETIDSKLIAQLIHEGDVRVVAANGAGKLQQEFGLDEGEAETLRYAFEKKLLVITDDKAAINACKVFGIPFATAMNIVIQMHKEGKLSSDEALAKIQLLEKYGRYASDIIKDAKSKAGGKT